jgi:3-hydroxyisobutyrate dehydrogenase-like beta-hydroxyacid dehydrogenase
VRAGHRVTVYNRNPAKAAQWVAEYGGERAEPAACGRGADVVCACVGNDDDLRSVVLGDAGAYAGMRAGAIFVDHTTASAAVARELAAEAVTRGLQFIDAPVSGGNVGATNGTLTVMCGGDPRLSHRPAGDRGLREGGDLLGPSGAGSSRRWSTRSRLPACCRACRRRSRSASGRPRHEDRARVIGKGAAQSWQMDNRGPTMIERRFDFGFAVDLMRKDLGLVLDEARRNGAQLPVTALVDQFYAELQADGGNRADTSSLIRRLKGKPEPPDQKFAVRAWAWSRSARALSVCVLPCAKRLRASAGFWQRVRQSASETTSKTLTTF